MINNKADDEIADVGDILKNAGFLMKEQEEEELSVTVGMLKDLEIVRKKKSSPI